MIYIYISIKHFIYLRKPVCRDVFVEAPLEFYVTMSKQFSGVPYENSKGPFAKTKFENMKLSPRKYWYIVVGHIEKGVLTIESHCQLVLENLCSHSVPNHKGSGIKRKIID